MKRRELMLLLAGAVTASRTLRAQQKVFGRGFDGAAFVHEHRAALGERASVIAGEVVGVVALHDHLVQHASEQLGLDVQRLAFADQPLRHRLATNVRGPDRTVQNPSHDQIILFRRGFGVAAPAGGRQGQGQKSRRQNRPQGSK